MDGCRLARLVLLALLAMASLTLGGCGSDDESPTTPAPATVEIQVTSAPTVSFNPATGSARDDYSFRFHAGDSNARVLP